MGFFISSYNRPTLTPCISVCNLRDDGLCEGCLRTADEISSWATMIETERLRVMFDVLPARRAREEAGGG